MQILDRILEVLSDGHYRPFIEIMTGVLEKTTVNENQLELALSFLEEAGFVKRVRTKWSTRTLKAALTPKAVKFLERIKWLEDQEEEAAHTSLEMQP